jgi:hypothetical protein
LKGRRLNLLDPARDAQRIATLGRRRHVSLRIVAARLTASKARFQGKDREK